MKQTKSFLISLSVVLSFLLVSSSFAQPWMQNIDKSKPINFYEVQREFDNYWQGKTITKGSGWKQFKRYEWFAEPRVFPSGFMPSGAMWEATKEVEMNFGLKSQNQISTSNWEALGPELVNSGGAGRLNCVTINPQNPSSIWVGAPAGGLWKSENGGGIWFTLTDNLPSLGISWVEIAQSDTNIMYIGTGDADANDTYSVGILKSTDGGSTWNTTGLDWNVAQTRRTQKVLIDPTNANILVAATSQGIYRSTDGAENWTQVASGNFRDLEVNFSNSNEWYAARDGNGVYKSSNGGVSWSLLAGGLPSTSGRIAIAVSQSNPSTVYSLFVNSTSGLAGIYKSTDYGTTWNQVHGSSPNLLSWDGSGSDGQGWYDLVLEVNPNNENQAFVGGVNLYRTNDGGTNWTKISHWYSGTGIPYVHADQHHFAFHPNDPNIIYAANDGGLFISINSGTGWADLSNGGMNIMQFYKIAISAQNPGFVLGGSQDNGTNRLLNLSWDNVLGGDGMDCAIDYSNGTTCYAEYYYGNMFRSTNSGNTFISIGGPIAGEGAWVTPIVIDPANPSTIYSGTENFFKSANQGTNWTQLASNINGTTDIREISVCEANTNVIYISTPNGVWKSNDGGASFSSLNSGLPTSSASVTNVKADPTDPNTAYVTFSGFSAGNKVFKTVNGGNSWQNISGLLPNIPHNCIVIDPTSTSNVYVGNDIGVFHSADGGITWEPYQNNLPNVVVQDLEIHASTNTLFAGTFGRGLWKSPITNIPPEISFDQKSITFYTPFANPSLVSKKFGSKLVIKNPIVDAGILKYNLTLQNVSAGGNEGRLVINEISVGTDWIELYNGTNTAVDISNYIIECTNESSPSENSTHLLPSFTIQPNSFVRVTEESGTNNSTTIFLDSNIWWGLTTSGSATLKDANGKGVDFVRWGSSTTQVPQDLGWKQNVLIPNPSSNSAPIARNQFGFDSDKASDWEIAFAASPAVTNPGDFGQNYTWLVFNALNGQVKGGEENEVSIFYKTQDLVDGIYNAELVVNSNSLTTPSKIIPIKLIIGASNLVPNVAINLAGNEAILTWKPVEVSEGYNIYKSVLPTTEVSEMEFVGSTSNNEFKVQIRENDLKYYFVVTTIFKED